MYEEGEGLEEDEKEEYEALLSKPLGSLPGTSLVNGSILDVQDQLQQFSCQIVILHEVHIKTLSWLNVSFTF